MLGLKDVQLLHGRFNYADRARIEGDLRPRAGRVLVGTQAVEVSLDLDFDCCFSELAPVESLLQRFGRVNRYGVRSSAKAVVFTQFDESSREPWRPYEQPHLDQVLQALRNHVAADPLIYERSVPGLIDASHPAELSIRLCRTIATRIDEARRSLVDVFLPFGMREMTEIAALEQAWEELFNGTEVLPSCCIEAAARSTSWIERSRYLVPISGSAVFWAKPTWNQSLKCFTTVAPYSSEHGLMPPRT